jgi:hypothetical protein
LKDVQVAQIVNMANSLLEKASIITTPTAYDNGSLHSVKPVKTFGSELVTNGDGSSTTGWDLSYSRTTLSINNNKLRATATEAGAYGLSQDLSLNTSKKYIITANINVDNASGGTANLRIATNVQLSTGATTLSTATGTTTTTFTPTASTMYIGIVDTADSSSNYVEIISISVKEVTEADFDFTRGSSATRVNEKGLIEDVQILSGNLVQNGDFSEEGSELVTNGSFDNNSDWSNFGTPTTSEQSTDKAYLGSYSWYVVATAFRQGIFSPNNFSLVNGKTYKASLWIYAVDGAEILSGVTNSDATVFTSRAVTQGQWTNVVYYFTANASSASYISILSSSSTLEFYVDNVSVKEVGQNWEFGTDWSMGDGVALHTGSTGNLITNASLTINKLYKVQFEIVSIADGVCNIYDTGSATTYASFTTIGLKSVYITKDSSNSLAIRSNSSNVTIDNISVIEITDDTDLPRINYTNFDYEDVLGDELVTNGSFSEDSNWTKDNAWSINNGKANCDGTQSGNANIYQPISFVVGKVYKVTYELSNVSSGSAKIVFGDTGGTLKSTNGIFTEYYTFVSGSNFYIQGNSSFIGSIDNVSVKEFTENVVVPYSGTGSLKLEPQRTNSFLYSEDFANSDWTKTASTITSNNIISPDGTLNASKLTEDTSNSTHRISDTIIVSGTGVAYTQSVFAKSGGNGRYLRMFRGSGTYNNAVFDLENGTVVAQGGSRIIDTKIETYPNGWYRCISTYTTQFGNIATYYGLQNGNTDSYQGDGESGVYLWGAMLEESSFATSYITTNGSTVTRLADVCNNAGSSDLINSTEGVLYAEVSKNTTTIDGGIAISDGSTDNRILLYFDTSGNIRAYVYASGEQARINTSGLNYTLMNKIAIKYSATSTKFFVNGNQVGSTDTSSNMPSGLSELAFDNGGGGSDFYGNVKTVAVFKEALDNDSLECLTGEGYASFDALAQANNYTII